MFILRFRDHREGQFPPDFEEVMEFGEKERDGRNRRSKGIKGSRQKASEAGGGCPCAARAGLMEEL